MSILTRVFVYILLALLKGGSAETPDGIFRDTRHTNNWAVLVCTSRFWFNYRHVANTMAMYRTVKRLGIPDSNIILMLADDMACNPRNQVPGAVFDHPNKVVDLYGDNIEVDYRGYEVTVENFIRLLTGRVTPETPRSKRLLTDDKSNILIFMTGHGGDEFLKFQDFNEISSYDIAYAFAQMWEKKRYNEILFMIDTCQANTMYKTFYSPNIIAMGSSNKGENSYSYHHDYELGVSVIDRFTYSNLNFFERVKPGSKLTLQDLVNSYDKDFIASTPGIRTDLFKRHLNETLLSEFFGAEQNLELTKNTVKVTPQNNQPRRNKVSLSTRLESYKGVVTRESNNHRLEVKHANFEYLNTVGSLMFMLFSYSIYSLFV